MPLFPRRTAKSRTSPSAGPNFDTLFATCVDRVYKRKGEGPSAQAFEAATQAGETTALINVRAADASARRDFGVGRLADSRFTSARIRAGKGRPAALALRADIWVESHRRSRPIASQDTEGSS